ncbi:MAG: 50S ribosomal protein L28 [Coriobacteriales bacterium]|nr:50S ribosomal protein L28 [Coriobacteriales bacterium]MBQ6586666.1 50S ribosomal protein L28 [Coriobacteriales bacterium]
MSKVCSICGKHPAAGRNVSHSHRVTNRIYRPNIQKITIMKDGHLQKANVCTQCIRSGKVARS